MRVTTALIPILLHMCIGEETESPCHKVDDILEASTYLFVSQLLDSAFMCHGFLSFYSTKVGAFAADPVVSADQEA